VGNELLDRVSASELVRHVDDRFRGRIGRAREHINDTVAAGAVPTTASTSSRSTVARSLA